MGVSDNIAENNDKLKCRIFTIRKVNYSEKKTGLEKKNEATSIWRRDHFSHFGDHVPYKLSRVKKYHRFASSPIPLLFHKHSLTP
jgi:hypothetical protein